MCWGMIARHMIYILQPPFRGASALTPTLRMVYSTSSWKESVTRALYFLHMLWQRKTWSDTVWHLQLSTNPNEHIYRLSYCMRIYFFFKCKGQAMHAHKSPELVLHTSTTVSNVCNFFLKRGNTNRSHTALSTPITCVCTSLSEMAHAIYLWTGHQIAKSPTDSSHAYQLATKTLNIQSQGHVFPSGSFLLACSAMFDVLPQIRTRVAPAAYGFISLPEEKLHFGTLCGDADSKGSELLSRRGVVKSKM